MLEKGTYSAKVLEQGFTKSTNGLDQFYLKVLASGRIQTNYETGEEYLEELPTPVEAEIYMIMMPDNEKAASFFIKKLRYAGFTGNRFEDINLVGSLVRCSYDTREWQDRVVDDWDLALPPKPKPVFDTNVARNLTMQFERHLHDQEAPPPPQRQQAPQGEIPGAATTPATSSQIAAQDTPF